MKESVTLRVTSCGIRWVNKPGATPDEMDVTLTREQVEQAMRELQGQEFETGERVFVMLFGRTDSHAMILSPEVHRYLCLGMNVPYQKDKYAVAVLDGKLRGNTYVALPAKYIEREKERLETCPQPGTGDRFAPGNVVRMREGAKGVILTQATHHEISRVRGYTHYPDHSYAIAVLTGFAAGSIYIHMAETGLTTNTL